MRSSQRNRPFPILPIAPKPESRLIGCSWIRRAWCTALGLCCLVASAATSAPPTPAERRDQRWRIASFAEDAGLARQNIFMFDFEADGTVWLAASGGLLRYDGYSWQRFGVEHGLPSHFVRAVLVAKNGELWVGTDKGAGTFDGEHFNSHGSVAGLAGPSVRRIVQDPDGTLWFCSDRWPDATVTSGITSYRHGVWTAYDTDDGLPSDHTYNYFRDAAGRQFVMTLSGVRQRFGARWNVPEGGEILQDAQCWSMAESREVGLVARSSDSAYRWSDGAWRKVPVPSSRHTGMAALFTTTRAGEIITADFNGSHFGVFRWNGQDIEPLSPAIEAGDHSAEYLREAPDGSIWACAYGDLTRWHRGEAEWAEFANLPFPRALDAQGRIWFVNANHAYRLSGDTFDPMPAAAGTAAADGRGGVWTWKGERILWHGAETRTFTQSHTGLATVRGHALDAKGNSWFDGETAGGSRAVAIYDGAQWATLAVPGMDRRQVVASTSDPVRGVWFLVIEPGQRQVSCVHVDRTGTATLTTDYGGIAYAAPQLVVDHAGVLWLSGQAGMFRLDRRRAAGWERITAIVGNVGRGLRRGDEVWFPYNGWTGGESGFAMYKAGKWKNFQGDYSDLLTSTPDGVIYVGLEEGMAIIPPGDPPIPSYLTFPGGERVHALVKSSDGTLWTGVVQPDGSGPRVLRYNPDRIPPRTVIRSMPSEVREDRRLVVSATARERFVPYSRPGEYRYSWRFGDEPWSTFQPLPAEGLPVAHLGVGRHRFQIRAQDEGLDVDPRPLEREIAVLPVPLQERAWFKPAVTAVVLAIFILAVVAVERARRFARANAELERAQNELEQRVADRTAELSRSNQQLAAEVAERKRAQDELEAVQGRLIETSRQAGMAEVATSVLHNVGNVLNSVNVATLLVADRIQSPKAPRLDKLNALLQQHAGNLGDFIANDPRGKKIADYVAKLTDAQSTERNLAVEELEQLRLHIDHIKEIVAMQQSYAKIAGVIENVPVADLVEDALRMTGAALERHGVKVKREFEAQPEIAVERHKVLQILVNIISNAKLACDERGQPDKLITARISQEDGEVAIAIIDNGIGIPPENLTRIFAHGFTTRSKGHGFGLHSGAIAAKELGGSLAVYSEGVGKGATFTLRLPLQTRRRGSQ